MAITVTTDLVDVNLSEATTNYAVLGTWATAIAASPDTYIQSANTVGGRISAATAWAHTSLAATDLSINQRHVFQWLKCISIPQLDTTANGGLAVTISSDATPTLVGTTPNDGPSNSKSWWVNGSEASTSGWICYVVDPNSTPSPGVVNGTPVITGIQRIGIRGKVVGTVGGGAVKPVNVVFDATRYGTGLTYTGDNAGTPGAFSDILTTAMSAANAWGILTLENSIYFGAGKFNFGTTSQTATSSFKSTGQLFVWRNFQVANTFYAWNINGAASFGTTFQLGNYTSGLVSSGNVVKGAGDPTGTTFAQWTLTAGTNTTVNLYATQFSEMRTATLQSTSSVRGCTFKNFGNITANGALFDSCTFQDLRTTAPISATYGVVVATTAATLTKCIFNNCATAVSWNVATDVNGKLDGSSFISGGTGYAIELGPNTPSTITLTNVIFTGYGAIGTTNACIYNNSGKAITINVIGGTNPTYNNGAGASTTVIAGAVSVTINVKDTSGTNIQNARVFVKADTGGPFPCNATVTISNSVTTATVTHTAHGMATNDLIVIYGASLQANNGIFTITKIDANSYSYTMGSAPGSSPTGTITSTFVLIGTANGVGGLTDASGNITMSRVFPSDQPIVGWARKTSTPPTYTPPNYKTGSIGGTVSSTTGFTANVQLVSDD